MSPACSMVDEVAKAPDTAPLLETRDLFKTFAVRGREITALNNLSIGLFRNETLAIVGESGSGKTTLANILLGIASATSGQIIFDGADLTTSRSRAMRRRIQLVQQNPYSTLNPRNTIRQTLELPLSIHGLRPKNQRYDRVAELLELVGLSVETMHRSPASLSGGQRQRIALARALACEPDIVILDEPTSALDVSVQARMLQLLSDLQSQLGLTYLFITHDLGVVRNIADRVAVLYFGNLVEAGDVAGVFNAPRHRYSNLLLASVPVISQDEEAYKPFWNWDLDSLQDDNENVQGCPFLPRCPYATVGCGPEPPQLRSVSKVHVHACVNPPEEKT